MSQYSYSLDHDVLSCILSHIYDPTILHTILRAIPVNHLVFDITLRRLCELPIHLSGNKEAAADTLAIVENLLRTPITTHSAPGINLAEVIRHLVISSVEGELGTGRTDVRERLLGLFQMMRNLRVLDWHGSPGPSQEELEVLQHLERLKTLHVDCPVPVEGDYWTESSWDISNFIKTLGPNLTFLDLRMVNLDMYRSLESHAQSFKSFHSLRRLAIDLTEGVWDWTGGGSPQMGPSDQFVFRCLGFSALREVEMRVADLTILEEKPGPLDLVSCTQLESLRLIIEPCFDWVGFRNIRLFNAVPLDDRLALKTLEIQDRSRNGYYWYWPDEKVPDNTWNEPGRCFWGLVPRFLTSLQNLTHLLVDQSVLCMPAGASHTADWADDVHLYDVTELWTPGEDEDETRRKTEWIGILQDVLGRIESLRVGFGPMNAEEVGRVLSCCNPKRLTQFGFQYKWQLPERDSTISSALLVHVSRLSKLRDIHILHPRPGTQHVYRSSRHADNARTIDDVTAIFNSNPSLCRVGVGQDAVWERAYQGKGNCSAGDYAGDVVLVQDGLCDDPRYLLDEAVPRFFDAGELKVYPDNGFDDDKNPRRPVPGPQIRELRRILDRVLPSSR